MDATEREPLAAPKVDPDSVALRAPPRPVMRLNRRTLALAAGVLALAIAGASMWALQSQTHRHGADQRELYNVDRVAKAEDLDRLPADYAKLAPKPAPAAAPAASVPALGPPMPGDWGAAGRHAASDSGPSTGTIDRQRDADAAARSSVFFRTGRDGTSGTVAQASPPPAVQDARAGPFDPAGAGPSSTAASPNDPTAIQNRQDQKEAFLAKAGDTATRNR
ncbi:conjugation TrbI family protein, partial [mine drainage metagenome]